MDFGVSDGRHSGVPRVPLRPGPRRVALRRGRPALRRDRRRLQQKLYDASPYNAIRLELTKDEPGDNEQRQQVHPRRRHPARLARRRTCSARTPPAALYVYEQEFAVEGKTYTRRGFLARVRLEPFGKGRSSRTSRRCPARRRTG